MCETHVFRLPDGRRLAYALWGDPNGVPVLLFHGSPGSRLFGRLFDDAGRRTGVRLIAPDRPGFGRSDPIERYTIEGVADDALALARGLGLERVAVAGVSGGAPYVYAAAARAPDLVSVGGVISGFAPLGVDEAGTANAPLVRAIRSHSRSAERRLRMLWFVLGLVVRIVARLPAAVQRPFLASYARSLPPPDREVIGRAGTGGVALADLAESLRQGSSAVLQELVAFLREPWGFELEDVRVPVLLWHGTEDQNGPVAATRRAAARLQRCEATYYNGEAHLSFIDHADEILRSVAWAAAR